MSPLAILILQDRHQVFTVLGVDRRIHDHISIQPILNIKNSNASVSCAPKIEKVSGVIRAVWCLWNLIKWMNTSDSFVAATDLLFVDLFALYYPNLALFLVMTSFKVSVTLCVPKTLSPRTP